MKPTERMQNFSQDEKINTTFGQVGQGMQELQQIMQDIAQMIKQKFENERSTANPQTQTESQIEMTEVETLEKIRHYLPQVKLDPENPQQASEGKDYKLATYRPLQGMKFIKLGKVVQEIYDKVLRIQYQLSEECIKYSDWGQVMKSHYIDVVGITPAARCQTWQQIMVVLFERAGFSKFATKMTKRLSDPRNFVTPGEVTTVYDMLLDWLQAVEDTKMHFPAEHIRNQIQDVFSKFNVFNNGKQEKAQRKCHTTRQFKAFIHSEISKYTVVKTIEPT
ncbi:hypothetical protein FOA43_001197 [Brettanomyces nanus]|uniref:Uncharacterized protein n=1 Tax=Eeniella nana TaxID=13502 RepID=A0A875S1A2_EENNA|nr:uncharacterized protein FOA43_001197 [Brettanomyces nanus]QPG73882.1 hypothetical protein FOA43_001197 [Brettanomyces nanus]